mmetsp:Transcript_7323/g.11015  ORF Transcript_7323/g.11015 Transcript_7323/m.11015 type:complete len:227 (+) Transcript_7323:262-942(+)
MMLAITGISTTRIRIRIPTILIRTRTRMPTIRVPSRCRYTTPLMNATPYSPAKMRMICTISPLITWIPRDRKVKRLIRTRSREEMNIQIPAAAIVPCHLVPSMETRTPLLLFLILDFPMMSLPSIPDIWTNTFKKANRKLKLELKVNRKLKIYLLIGGDAWRINIIKRKIRRVLFQGSPFRRNRPKHCLLPSRILILILINVKINPLHLLLPLSHILTHPHHTTLY